MANKTKKSAKEQFIARKMHAMAGEDKPNKQKVAIAYSYAKRAGL